jgi:hypothetical protein
MFTALALDASAAVTARLVDGLVVSGAPLKSVAVRGFSASDSVRLLAAVPTIVSMYFAGVAVTALPAAIAERMHAFDHIATNEHLPRLAHVSEVPFVPSDHVTSVDIPGPSSIAALPEMAAAFPKLRNLALRDAADVDAADTMASPPLTFSATLEKISAAGMEAGAAFRFVRRLSLLPQLTNVTELAVNVTRGSFIDITPLANAAFARTLRRLEVNAQGGATHSDAQAAITEAAVSHLVALEHLNVGQLPTARGVLAGNHRRLRTLTVRDVNTPEAPFTSIIRACPRLVYVWGKKVRLGFTPPQGWAAETKEFVGACARRLSFA